MQGALEWLEQVQDKTLEEINAPTSSTNATIESNDDPNAEPPALEPGEVAKSLVCNDCGKRFRSVQQAEFHGAKTEHVNFAESRFEVPQLTEEEKKVKLEALRRKLLEKRSDISEQDKMDKKKNEVNNRDIIELGAAVDFCLGNSAKEYKGGPRYQGRSAEERTDQGGRGEASGKGGRNCCQGEDQGQDYRRQGGATLKG